MSSPKYSPTVITPKAKRYLVTVLLPHWERSKEGNISIVGAISDLILSVAPDAPYPAPHNGQGH
jgi:hypothetical protein